MKKKNVRLNTDVLTQIKVQSINYVALHAKASNKLRCDAIMLGDVYICDVAHNEILKTLFSREELNYDELILEEEVGSSYNKSEYNEI